jgi:hypothetical protein
MERKEGYYWVKIDTSTEELKYHGNHWRAALWYCNNGDGSDLLWRIAGDDTRFDDDDFFEINETRILPPDEQNPTLGKVTEYLIGKGVLVHNEEKSKEHKLNPIVWNLEMTDVCSKVSDIMIEVLLSNARDYLRKGCEVRISGTTLSVISPAATKIVTHITEAGFNFGSDEA